MKPIQGVRVRRGIARCAAVAALCEYIIFNIDIKVRGLSKFKIVIKIHWVYKFEHSLSVYIHTLEYSGDDIMNRLLHHLFLLSSPLGFLGHLIVVCCHRKSYVAYI